MKKTACFSILLLVVFSLFAGLAGCSDGESVTLNVSAAASMTDAINEVNDVYMQANGNVTVLANFASSGTLRQQIETGAPADVFISASAKHMNILEEAGLILTETRQDLLNNKIVLIVPDNSTLDLDDFMDLLNSDVKQIALGDPEFVPAGTYGKEALDVLGIYEQVQSKLILGSDVRQVLSYVESGNVDAGIVYSTDAAISESVTVVADAPAEVNDKIVYPVSVIKASANVDAAGEYIAFLLSDEARAIFEKYGFSPISQ